MDRKSGILLPVFSLPSPYGIGTIGKEAYEWVDFLFAAGQKVWQVLPLGPTGFGDSPYQSFSSFAGNPYFIDLDTLVEKGLLKKEEPEVLKTDEKKIDYAFLYNERFKVLRKAFRRFSDSEALEKFKEENPNAYDYALYMAIKNSRGGASWDVWPKTLKKRNSAAIRKAEEKLKDEIDFYIFMQIEFMDQWTKLKAYANKKGIKIIGDVPIYASFDSADVWKNPKQFYLDAELNPIEVAGCPPDGFTEDGQLWGNPLYRWDYMKKKKYSWWKERLTYAFKLFDVIRIDHFRGLESYYSIPAGDKTARNGKWNKGPDKDFVGFLKETFADKEVIAEDLGFLTEDVHKLLAFSGFPGMKVMHFAFDGDIDNLYLPHNYKSNCVVYTGTHDNDTTVGWLHSAKDYEVKNAKEYLHLDEDVEDEEFTDNLVEAALKSEADLCVIPLQDYLYLGSEARINTPSTDRNNWVWRLDEDYLKSLSAEKIKSLTKKFFR